MQLLVYSCKLQNPSGRQKIKINHTAKWPEKWLFLTINYKRPSFRALASISETPPTSSFE